MKLQLRGFFGSIKKKLIGLLHLGQKGLLLPIKAVQKASQAVEKAMEKFPTGSPRNDQLRLFGAMIGVYAFMYMYWSSFLLEACNLSKADAGWLMAIFMGGRFGLSNFFGLWAAKVQKIVAIRVGFLLAILAAIGLVTTRSFTMQALFAFLFGGTWGAAANLIKAYALGHLNPKSGPDCRDSIGFLYAVGAMTFVVLGFALGFVKDVWGITGVMATLPIFMCIAATVAWYAPDDYKSEDKAGPKNDAKKDSKRLVQQMGLFGQVVVCLVSLLKLLKEMFNVKALPAKMANMAHNTGQSLVVIGSHFRQKRVWGFFTAAMIMWGSYQAYWFFFTPFLINLGCSNFVISLIWNIGVTVEVLCSWNIGFIKEWLGNTVNVFVISIQSAAMRWIMLSGFGCLVWWFGDHSTLGFWLVIVAIQLQHGMTFSGFIIPGAQLTGTYFPEPHDGLGQTLYGSLVEGLAAAAGCIVSGILWEAVGPEFTFLIAAFCCLIAWALADQTQRPKKPLIEGIRAVSGRYKKAKA